MIKKAISSIFSGKGLSELVEVEIKHAIGNAMQIVLSKHNTKEAAEIMQDLKKVLFEEVVK